MTGFIETTANWLATPSGVSKLIISPQKKMFAWKEVYGGLNPTLKQDRAIVERTDTLMNWYNLPDKVNRAIKAFKAIRAKDPVLKTAENSIVASSHLANLIKMWAFGGRFLHQEGLILLSQVQLAAIRSIGLVATFFSLLQNGIDIKNIIYKFQGYQPQDPGLRFELLQLICKVCSFIINLSMIGVFAFGGKVLVLTVGTISLVFSISKYYYKQICIINSK